MARKMTEVLPNPVAASTVQYWDKIGYIPPRRQEQVLKAAEALSIELDRSEFIHAEPRESAPEQVV